MDEAVAIAAVYCRRRISEAFETQFYPGLHMREVVMIGFIATGLLEDPVVSPMVDPAVLSSTPTREQAAAMVAGALALNARYRVAHARRETVEAQFAAGELDAGAAVAALDAIEL